MFSSLRFRLTLWYVLVLAVILVTFSITLYNGVRISQFNEFETALFATADIIENKLENSVVPLFNPSEVPLKEEIFYQKINRLGQIEERSSNLGQMRLPLDEAAQAAVLRNQTYLEYVTLANGRTIALVTQGYGFFGGIGFQGVVQVGAAFQRVSENLSQLRFWLWVVVPITLILTSFGGVFLADRLLKPLAQMNKSAREISSHHLNRRLPVVNPKDELGKLATTLNQLFDRLEKAFQNQQRFIADASHELRTPMAAIRAEIEVALRRERSAQEYKDLALSTLDEVTRMSRLVERLLFLTQSDAGQLPVQLESVRLDEVCCRVFEKLKRLSESKNINLALDDLQSCTVQGDPELLEQLLMILVENAIKYTPADGQVTISCGHNRKEAWFQVKDTGIGIAEEHLSHLFERFYRVDKARSRQLGGSGLGLSIAHSIVTAHGGRLQVQSRLQQGSTFRAFFAL